MSDWHFWPQWLTDIWDTPLEAHPMMYAPISDMPTASFFMLLASVLIIVGRINKD